ncbi:MAG: hypothetical protein PF904_06745 [Kiritimatiellae bacterium]|jgi:hypothetical protein|nr:hypothetical protein [Kiritimatiellia bacterium]
MLTYRISGYIALTLAAISAPFCKAAGTESYTPPPFSHFEPILKRMPFGELPDKIDENVDPNAAKQDALLRIEQEKLARKINMSAVNITPEGVTAIGFTDLSAKPPVNYYLLVGSESGGWKVNSANYTEEIAEIEKDGVIISLQLGKGLLSKPAAPSPVKKGLVSKNALAALRKKPTVRSRPAPMSPSAARKATTSGASIRDQLRKAQTQQKSSDDARSYVERRRQRGIEQSKALEHAKKTQRKQLEKLAREVASKEIQKQAAIAEEVALEKELQMEEEKLQKLAEEEKSAL